MPPFDYEKAKQLSPGKRREYDVVFYNEIVVWNMSSNRYGEGDNDSYIGRDAEFRRMAADGYLPAYVALRLLDINRGSERDDPEALAMLVKAADAGDASAMCAIDVMPMNKTIKSDEERIALARRMEESGFARKHPTCMTIRGNEYLFGKVQGVPLNKKAAMPLLLETARQGYYVASNSLFGIHYLKALSHQFDFSNQAELKRALCWGRLAEQHTNWAGFDYFLSLLRDYSRANNRPDLVEMSWPYDPRRVPIRKTVVKPEDCIQLEQGE